jgi:predicted ATPase
VSGRTFESDVVGAVAGVGQDALVDAIDEAERAHLLMPGRVPGELMFVHELIPQALLSGLSSVKRERLHLNAANAISERYFDDLEAHAADLAHHLSHAGGFGDRASLVRYLMIAGDRAFEAAAFYDAVGHFEHALSVVPAGDQRGRAQLLERLAMALRSVGRWDDALQRMNGALDGYQALDEVKAIGRLGWAMVYQLTWSARLVEGVQVGQRTLAALGDTVSADRARVLSALGWAISISGDYAAATRPSTRHGRLPGRWAMNARLPTCYTCRPFTI